MEKAIRFFLNTISILILMIGTFLSTRQEYRVPTEYSPVDVSQPKQDIEIINPSLTQAELLEAVIPPPKTPTEPIVEPVAQPPSPPTGDKYTWMAQAGIPEDQWGAVDYIINKESSWRVAVVNYLGCIGLGQSCPNGSGLEDDCPNWQNDPVCQLQHFSSYATERYGGWWPAYNFWVSKNWW